MSRDTADRYWWSNTFKRFPMDGVAKGIARAIADESDRSTGQICRVTMDDLVLSSGQSERTIQRKLPVIAEAGFLRYTASTVKGTSSVYQLTIPEGLPLERPKDGSGREQISAWLVSKGVSVTPKAKGVSASPKSDLGRQCDALTGISGVTQSGSGDSLTPPPLLHEEISTSSAADAAVDDSKLSISGVWAELRAGLESLLDAEEYDGRAMAAYLVVLDTVDQIAPGLTGLSKQPVGFLQDRLVAHAAAFFFAEDVKPSSLPRLYRASRQLGSTGARHLIEALAWSSTADISGDPTSYVIKTAQNRKADQ